MPRPSEFSLRTVRHSGLVLSDILVNGVPLRERLNRHEEGRFDHVSPLGWIEGSFERLALESPPDLPGGRTSILVCSQCGDLGCGAVSAVIRRDGTNVLWNDMGLADNLGIDGEGPWLFEKVTSFVFDWESYAEALMARRADESN